MIIKIKIIIIIKIKSKKENNIKNNIMKSLSRNANSFLFCYDNTGPNWSHNKFLFSNRNGSGK